MQKTYILRGNTITVDFKDHSVHIVNDKALWALLSTNDMQQSSDELVLQIIRDFQHENGRPLDITADSLVVEIWGHVYFEYFALATGNLVQLKLIEQLVDTMVKYSDVIDCGEPGYDSNRKVWDLLGPHKERIAGWLPKNIEAKNWKT